MNQKAIKVLDVTSDKPARQTSARGFRKLPEEGFIAAACRNGKHTQCPSLRCSCGCHKEGLG